MSLFHGEFPELRDFQKTAHEAIRQAVREGHRMILVMAPTGSGKTILGMNVVRETNATSEVRAIARRAMFLCDRKTLIAQTSNVAREIGLGNHGIIQANNPLLDMTRPFQIASCQTLMRRGWPNDIHVLLVDEAHTLYKTWVDFVTTIPETCPRCDGKVIVDPARPNFPKCERAGCWAMPIVIGLTATAFTAGLGKIFTKLINAVTMHELVNRGELVPMRIFSCRKPDMDGAETQGGEWTKEAAAERELVIVGDVIQEWIRYAENRKTIVFGSTILHCEEMARQFNEAGIPTATFCADTEDHERARILRGFQDGDIRILISVEALAKGFDVPDVGCVCDCRPLRKSLSTAIQMWGRGLRSSVGTGKKDCYLLDFSGNIIRFADDFSRIYFEGLDKLDEGELLDKEIRKDTPKEAKSCPRCHYSPMGGKKCVGCGYEIPQKPSLIEQRPGEMTEITLANGKHVAKDKLDLFAQLATYVKASSITDPEKREKRAKALFKAIANDWPPRGLTVATAPEVLPNRNTVNKIRSVYTAWANSPKKGVAA